MALLSELVRVVAQTEGLDEVSVGIYARQAREAGYISQGGRGRSAARMSFSDAANLLIAVNGCSLAKEVKGQVPLLRSLRIKDPHSRLEDHRIFLHNAVFGEDLERILELVSTEKGRRILADGPAQIIIQFERPGLRVGVEFFLADKGGAAIIVTGSYRGVGKGKIASKGDRTDVTIISQRTLIAVADLINQQ